MIDKPDNMHRLQIAAQFASGIIAAPGGEFYYSLQNPYMLKSISRTDPDQVARVAFIYADALIAEYLAQQRYENQI